MNTLQLPKILAGKSKQVADFLMEIDAVCRQHGLSISHEDEQGAFRVMNYDPVKRDWLWRAATKLTAPVRPMKPVTTYLPEFESDDLTQHTRSLCEIS